MMGVKNTVSSKNWGKKCKTMKKSKTRRGGGGLVFQYLEVETRLHIAESRIN